VDDIKAFVEFQITKSNEHDHTVIKKNSLRGEKRIEVARDCILTANGSASGYVDGKTVCVLFNKNN
jgi:hypothetical protein